MKFSNCCGEPIIDNTDLCSKCKEHCETLAEVDEELAWLVESTWMPNEVIDYKG